MKVKKELDYALQALVNLASEENRIASSKVISKEEKISRDYLIQIFQHLRDAGIVASTSGKHGGYRLACDVSEISVRDVALALDGENECGGSSKVAQVVTEALDQVLADLSIRDLVTSAG